MKVMLCLLCCDCVVLCWKLSLSSIALEVDMTLLYNVNFKNIKDIQSCCNDIILIV